jgi:hypothetical protein
MLGGKPAVFDGVRTRLQGAIQPGESRRLKQQVMAPDVAGDYDLVVTMVQEGRFWLDAHSTSGQARAAGIRIA